MKTRVVNRYAELYDVYIGRPSKWGNPFLPEGGTERARLESIAKYREWIMDQANLLAVLDELKGKRLGCYCAPKPCHGDVLVELVNKMHEPSVSEVKNWLQRACGPIKPVAPEIAAQFPHQGWTGPGRSNYIQLMEAYIRLKTQEETNAKSNER